MATEKQILANRQNALKGGVKTAAGKSISKMNAVTHGILASDVLLPGEDVCQLSALHQVLLVEFAPANDMENILLERIISCLWRLKRTLRSERKYSHPHPLATLGAQGDFVGGDYRYRSWQNFARYETSLENRFYKALRELDRLQSIRLGKPVS